jgi:transcriptional regulator with XRE-family HTH domain
MSAEQLAAAVSDLGYRYTRTQVTNLESGRRDAVTESEIYAFAAVLDVPPALLMVPLGSDDEVELLPGISVDPWTAYRWLIGELPTHALREKPTHTNTWYVAPLVAAYRQHDRALKSYVYAPGKQEALVMLARARINLAEHGWHLPPLPDGIAEALREPLGWLGWRSDESGALVRVRPIPDQAFRPVQVDFDPDEFDPEVQP